MSGKGTTKFRKFVKFIRFIKLESLKAGIIFFHYFCALKL